MIDAAEIHQFTCDIWAAVLGLELAPIDRAFQPTTDTINGCVQIAGGWHGAVVIECPVPLAERAAAVMFGLAPDAVTAEQARDALGELANILGGNIKPLLPGPSHLSLPSVASGTCCARRSAGGNGVAEGVFECEGHPVLLAVVQDGHPRAAVTEDAACPVGR